jgi:hypothetical protein
LIQYWGRAGSTVGSASYCAEAQAVAQDRASDSPSWESRGDSSPEILPCGKAEKSIFMFCYLVVFLDLELGISFEGRKLMFAKFTLTIQDCLDRIFVLPILLYRFYRFGSAFRKIYLGFGYLTLLDPDDYYRVKHFKWWVHSNGTSLYAARTAITPDLKSKIIYLHRQIMDPPEDRVVDHRFGDTLDNRRQNLRIVTQAENMRNRRKRKNTSSRFIGVSFRKSRHIWDGNIRVNGRKLWLGSFDNEIDAARAYDAAAKKYIGNGIRLNFK